MSLQYSDFQTPGNMRQMQAACSDNRTPIVGIENLKQFRSAMSLMKQGFFYFFAYYNSRTIILFKQTFFFFTGNSINFGLCPLTPKGSEFLDVWKERI